MKVSVIGAGSWGTTLAILLAENKHNVKLWEFDKENYNNLTIDRENKKFLPNVKFPDNLLITNDINDAVDYADVIVNAVPTQFIRNTYKSINNNTLENKILVNVSKGIEVNTQLRISQIFKDLFPNLQNDNLLILSGPSHAEEVSRKIPTAVVIASTNEKNSILVQEMFMNNYFRVYRSNDVIGVELGGAVKNVMAIGAGIIDGIGYGDNTKAALMTRGIVEIARMGKVLGADTKTFSGLSGIGDLIVTCSSKHSRNRYVGEQIGKGRKLKDIISEMNMVAEGVETTKSSYNLAKSLNVETPIINEVYEVLFNDKNPHDAIDDLMTRDMKPEHY
ncbi:MAG TPA: NAD(P)H-dependent glycerol-3-phosphate dehydrogenase [Ignavibacteriales bacterium]|nr:NAD(P)H-dependent glycerol-3-phosphate dehydrogenase [Ignavibacteriales bacterium]HPD67090.1 NAD(P)H-dependent glycerol-3-phosphate dehydrogenase [Ignavibacteriales bacterium]HRR19004.1 NAD(P)H-dependent glycerol-3-phosphate dehydrogenase [Ignavibacteriales bacterium]HRT99189.1 NAD(P)H-dependent glycerol-3-phosphate dehydrogenase [Ignavibacteriales bacterium]